MMKPLKYPSDVEGVGIRGKENTWMEVVIPCQLGIFKCMCEQNLTTSPHSAEAEEWRTTTNKKLCSKRKPIPHKTTREMGAIYFKRRRHRSTGMIVSHALY